MFVRTTSFQLLLSLDDTAGRGFDEVKDHIAFGRSRDSSLDLNECLGGVHTAVVDEAIDLLDSMDLLGSKSTTIESNRVDATELNRFACCDSIRRYILVDARSALHHTVTTNMGELVNERTTADDGEIVHLYLTGQLRGIGHDDIIVQDAVVRHVAISHDEVVVADNGLALAGRPTMDSNELTQHAVVADDGPCLFSTELEVLRYSADDG